jgi:hypothetical protein
MFSPCWDPRQVKHGKALVLVEDVVYALVGLAVYAAEERIIARCGP